MGAVQGEATYNVVTYPVYVHYNSGYYHYYVGDDEATVVSMSRSEFTSKYQEASNPKFPVSTSAWPASTPVPRAATTPSR